MIRLFRLNCLFGAIYIALICYFMSDTLSLDRPLRCIPVLILTGVVIYLSFRKNWNDNDHATAFTMATISLVIVSVAIPELRFEGIFFINIALIAIALSFNTANNILYLCIAAVLTVLSFIVDFIQLRQLGMPNSLLSNFSILVFGIFDLCFKMYIVIRTNQIRLQNLLQRSIVNEQYANLFGNSFDPILLYDSKKRRIVEVNNSVSKLLGLPNQELIGKELIDFLLEDNDSNLVLLNQLDAKVAENNSDKQEIFTCNCVFKNKDNSLRQCIVQVVPIEKKEGFFYIICVDRTEEIEAKEQLEQASQDYRNIFDNNLLGVNSLDGESSIIKTNHSFCEMLGFTKQDLIGKSIIDFVHEDSITEITELLKLLKNGEIQSFIQEIKFSRADENVLQTLISVRGVYQEKILTQSICTVQDISQRKEIEYSLTQSESKYREIFDNSLSGIAIVSQWRFLDVNKSLANILELDESEIVGKSLSNFLHTDDLEHALNEAKSLSNGKVAQKQIMLKAIAGGRLKRLLVSMTKIDGQFDDNEPIGILNIIDLTELLEMQTQLNERQAIYEALVDSSFTGIDVCEYVHNEETKQGDVKLIFRNKLLSYYLSDPVNKNEYITYESLRKITPDKFYERQSASATFNRLAKELLETKKINVDWSFKCEDGIHDFNVYVRLVQVDGKSLIIRNFLDITEKRKKDKIILNQLYDINKKKNELEKYIESNLQLENFAYIASHDLKAPLRTVSSFAYLLKKTSYEGLNEKGRKYLDIIISSSSSMQVLIHDLLQFARINQDKLTIKRIGLKKFLDHCIENLYQDIADCNGKVEFLNIPPVIIADEVKLMQMFQNLIRNGLKFRRAGVNPIIKINCEENPEEWIFSVRDNGIGIHEENRERIFGIFNKLHSEDEFEGTGLGLTICKKIIEKHGGKIWLESTVNKGTTFYFSINKQDVQRVDANQLAQEIEAITEEVF